MPWYTAGTAFPASWWSARRPTCRSPKPCSSRPPDTTWCIGWGCWWSPTAGGIFAARSISRRASAGSSPASHPIPKWTPHLTTDLPPPCSFGDMRSGIIVLLALIALSGAATAQSGPALIDPAFAAWIAQHRTSVDAVDLYVHGEVQQVAQAVRDVGGHVKM